MNSKKANNTCSPIFLCSLKTVYNYYFTIFLINIHSLPTSYSEITELFRTHKKNKTFLNIYLTKSIINITKLPNITKYHLLLTVGCITWSFIEAFFFIFDRVFSCIVHLSDKIIKWYEYSKKICKGVLNVEFKIKLNFSFTFPFYKT